MQKESGIIYKYIIYVTLAKNLGYLGFGFFPLLLR